jgi:hypothetical protein
VTFARATAGPAAKARAPDTTCSAIAKPAPVSNQAMLRRIQRKPAVGAVSDPLEREADTVAEHVLGTDAPIDIGRSAPPTISRKCARCGSETDAFGGKCDDCEEEEKTIRRKADGGASAIDPGDAAGALTGGGSPLPTAARAYFEPRFGRDLSDVRIHTHGRAETAARAIDAKAYTLGADIAFARGAFAPGTREGDRLIAHELAHVVQQTHNPGLPVQRQPAPQNATLEELDKPSKIVKIVAEAGTLWATAIRSDGTIGSLKLLKNEMPPGEYQFTKDRTQADPKFASYTSDGPKNGFIWDRAVVDDTVRVVVVPSYVEEFLRAHETPYGPATGPRDNLRAAELLAHFGVTKGELLLQLQKEEENDQEPSDRSVDVTDWALSFIGQKREAEQTAFEQRGTLAAAAARLSRLPSNTIGVVVQGISDRDLANQNAGLREMQRPVPYFGNEFTTRAELWATLDAFSTALEGELHALTEAMLNEASATIFEIKRRFVGTRALGIGEGYLEDELASARADPEIVKARADIGTKSDRTEEIARRQERENQEALESHAGSRAGPDADVQEAERAEAKQQLQKARDQLRVTFSQRTKIDITGIDQIDPEDLLTSKSGEDAQIKLKNALWSQDEKINTARRLLRRDSQFVFRADKIIALEKKQLGIEPGSILDQIVDGIVAAKSSPTSFWHDLWEVIGFVVSFVPPPAGPIMRAVVAGINLISALDEHADQAVAHDTHIASSGPGSLTSTLLMTAAGTLFDAGELTGLAGETKALTLGLETETAGTRALGAAEHATPPGKADLESVADDSAAAVKTADAAPTSAAETFPAAVEKEAADASKFAQEHPQKPKGEPGHQSIDIGKDHKIVEVEEAGTGAVVCEFHSGRGPKVPCPTGMGRPGRGGVRDTLKKLRDPEIFKLYRQSLRSSEKAAGTRVAREAAKASAELDDIATSVARFVEADGTVNAKVADAVWALPENLRGVLIEKALSKSKYSNWFNVGSLDRGFFPEVDFALTSQAGAPLVSLKTVNPYLKGYEDAVNGWLPHHVEEIVSGEINYIGRGYAPRKVTLEVIMPQKTSIPAEDLLNTLESHIPSNMRRYIKIEVNEF